MRRQVEDFAFAGQHVVDDAKAEHGFEVAGDDGIRDNGGEFGQFAFAGFDCVERLRPPFHQGFFVVGVIGRRAGVEVPTVVVEARLVGQEKTVSI